MLSAQFGSVHTCYPFIDIFVGTIHESLTFTVNNSLYEQGLGGACELAIAQARFTLASPVYMQSNNLFLPLVREFFGRGAGEQISFGKRFPRILL